MKRSRFYLGTLALTLSSSVAQASGSCHAPSQAILPGFAEQMSSISEACEQSPIQTLAGADNEHQVIAKLTQPTRQTCASVTYKIPQKTINPGEAVYLEVPSQLQDRRVKFVVLGHFQSKPQDAAHGYKGDWDNEPALTSVQFHSSDDKTDNAWRYWGGPSSGEGGAKYAENRGYPELEGLYHWGTNGHYGVKNKDGSTAPLHTDGIRVVNVGKSSVFFTELQLKVDAPKADEFRQAIFSSGTRFENPEDESGEHLGRLYDGLSMGWGMNAPKLPEGWSVENGELTFTIPPGKIVTGVEAAVGDAPPNGGSGGAAFSIGYRGADGQTDWFVPSENVPPTGVILGSPTECGRVARQGDKIVLRGQNDQMWLMGARIGLKSAK